MIEVKFFFAAALVALALAWGVFTLQEKGKAGPCQYAITAEYQRLDGSGGKTILYTTWPTPIDTQQEWNEWVNTVCTQLNYKAVVPLNVTLLKHP